MAVLRDGETLTEISGDPSLTHGQRLPSDLGRALETAGVVLDEVGLLAVIAGPGSFTGLRVGIAAVQGLAFSRGLAVVPVSALEAIGRHAFRRAADAGQAASLTPSLVAPWIDAQRGEVFAIVYEGDVDRPLVSASSAQPQATLDSWADSLGSRFVVFAGDGAVRYRDTIARALGARAAVLDPAPALAAEAARIAAGHPERAVAPHAIVPIYVRRPDAELARGRAGR